MRMPECGGHRIRYGTCRITAAHANYNPALSEGSNYLTKEQINQRVCECVCVCVCMCVCVCVCVFVTDST